MKNSDTSRYSNELDMLLKVSELLDQSLDMRVIVTPVLELLDEKMGFRSSSITLISSTNGEIQIDASHGLQAEQVMAGHYRIGEGVTGRVVLTGEQIIVPHTSRSSLFLNRTQYGTGVDYSFICVPVKERQEVLGTLSVFRDVVDETVLANEAGVLVIVASMIARAMSLRLEMKTEQESLLEENRKLRAELSARYHPDNIIGNSREMQVVYGQISQVAKSNATVLIQGETGTGKELVAHAIHYASPRASGPFVRVHCAALPESLIESELFGHVRGAFTGAVSDRKGRFELADGGTIFLDEVGEIPLSIQAKLLRVLQEREFERVGGLKTIKVDVRILAATHRNIPSMIENGTFREDLYYRLSVFPIFIPPLRKRVTDIQLLTDFFLKRYANESGKPIDSVSNDALDALNSYRWPGNVRELENCIERAVLLSEGNMIQRSNLSAALQSEATTQSKDSTPLSAIELPQSGRLDEIVGRYEAMIISAALKRAGGNISAAARELSSTPRIIGYKVKRYGLDTTTPNTTVLSNQP